MEMMSACYQKPFNLFPYNKPKQPPLRERKGPIDYRAQPKLPVRSTNATRLRDKVIKQYMNVATDTFEDYHKRLQESGRMILQEPEVMPRDNKTSNYRYKWAREVPVVSCRFTEHVMMYKKPPFTYEKLPHQTCGAYRLRNMEIKDPVREEFQSQEKPAELEPSILM